MTIEVTNPVAGPYTPNGATTDFPFSFKIMSTNEIRVVDASENEIDLGYSVTLAASGEGGTVKFTNPPSADVGEFYIQANPAFGQPTLYGATTTFNPGSLNNPTDRLAAQNIILKNLSDRSIRYPIGEDTQIIPPAADRASKFIAHDASGNIIMSSGTGADAGLRTDLADQTGAALVKASDGNTVQANLDHGGRFTPPETGGTARTGAAGILDLSFNPKNVGAVGDGVTDDSAAFQQCFSNSRSSLKTNPYTTKAANQIGIWLPPGQYYIGSTITINGGNFYVAPIIPGTVEIILADGIYFLTSQSVITTINISGLKVTGGKGFYNGTNTSANSAGMMVIEDCTFAGYTECAIGNNSTDSPYLKVSRNTFYGRTGTSAIGIAWGGLLDDLHIHDNAFLQNAYHIKLGGDAAQLSGSFRVEGNSFLSFGGIATLADIWLVPSYDAAGGGINSGFNSFILRNKFGNENQAAGTPRILVDREDTNSGTTRATRTPLATYYDGTSYMISALTVAENQFAAGSDPEAPIIASYVSNLRGWYWANNTYVGGLYSYAVQFMGSRTTLWHSVNWTADLGPGGLTGGLPFSSGLFSNSPIGVFNDPIGTLQTEPQVCLAGGATEDASASTPIVGFATSGFTVFGTGASATTFTDNYGGANGQEVVCGSGGGGVYVLIGTVAAGARGYIQLQLQQAPSQSVTQVYVELFKTGANPIMQHVVTLPASLTSISIPFMTSVGGTNYAVRIRPVTFVSGTTDTFRVAHVCFNYGRRPAHSGHLATAGTGGWDQPHVTLGAYHLWVDSTGELRIKSSAPTSDTDGATVGSQT